MKVETAPFSTLLKRGRNGNLKAYSLGYVDGLARARQLPATTVPAEHRPLPARAAGVPQLVGDETGQKRSETRPTSR